MKAFFKNFALVVVFLVGLAGLFSLFSQKNEEPKEISLSQLVSDINESKIKNVAVTDDTLTIVYNDESKAVAKKEIDSSLSQTLVNLGVNKDALHKSQFRIQRRYQRLGMACAACFTLLCRLFSFCSFSR